MPLSLRLGEHTAAWRLRAAAAVLGLVVAATSTVSPLLDVPTGRLLLAVGLSVIPAMVAIGFMAPRTGAATMVVAVPAMLLAAGLPLRALTPHSWGALFVKLGGGIAEAMNADGHTSVTPASFASIVLMAGTVWTAGAALGVSNVRRRDDATGVGLRGVLSFGVLAWPWALALSLRLPDHSAWQGAVVLIAGVLWFCRGSAALLLAVVVAVPATALARGAGPSSQWFGLAAPARIDPPFRALDPEPTYGPLNDRRTGTTMLVVTAPRPALWRMQTLDYAGGSWMVDGASLPTLPQPAARREEVQVNVRRLHNDLLVAPGRIERVSAPGKVTATNGEAMRIAPMPGGGATYRVTTDYVQATAAQLSRDRTPLDPAARAYTRVPPTTLSREQPQWLGWPLNMLTFLLSMRQARLDPRVVGVARRLASGAHTEWEIVTRVERYLRDSGQFRYTTNVADPGPQPIVDFLLRTHAGYCQHFAGAAALLLRLAGVPARVVSGFATGTQIDSQRYVVRDLDAHEWIEVYFQGYGWVSFNPTPAAASAHVASGVDPLLPRQGPGTPSEGLAVGAALAVLASVSLPLVIRRRRQTRASTEPLARIVRRAGGTIGPSTTLAEIRTLLAGRVGPRTAAIASDIERERFAAGGGAVSGRLRLRVARALLGDLGLVRLLLFWVPVPHPRVRAASRRVRLLRRRVRIPRTRGRVTRRRWR
jgi:protein-glutamine gamma-glutamyltransferase